MNNKKTTFVLLSISFLTLLIMIVSATYAYFALISNTGGTSYFTSKTDMTGGLFVGVDTGSLYLNVPLDMMYQRDSNDNVTGISASSGISMSLTSAGEGKISTCSFDIIYVPNENSSDYNRTNGVLKEYTIEAHPQVTNRLELTASEDPDNSYVFNLPDLEEVDFANLDWKTKEVVSIIGEEEVTREIKYATLLENVTVSSNTNKISTGLTYDFTARYYNSTKNQNDNLGKVYAGVISIDKDTLNCNL